VVTLLQDLRYGLRTLRKSPAFTVIALFTLALGIGANTAIFSIVNAVLLKPLPFHESDRLTFMTEMYQTPNGQLFESSTSYPDFFDWRERGQSFQAMASYHGDEVTLTGSSQPLHLSAATVSGDFFSVVGTKPLMGRGFTRDDEKPGTRVTVLSHELWQNTFGGDQNVVGRTITLDQKNFTVIGVMPAGYVFPLDNEVPKLWRTFAAEAEVSDPKSNPVTSVRGAHFLSVVGRLKDGVTLEHAREEMNVIARALAAQYPVTNKRHPATKTVSELEHLVGDTRPALIVLLVAVGCVLLIACVNVANLLLVRASKRSREIAVRTALGARRLRVVRQMLTESLVLAFGGALLAIPLALWSLKLFISLNLQDLPRVQSANIDGTVMAFVFGITLLTSVFFGLAPALRASSPNLVEFMKEGRSTTATKKHQRLRSTLVVVETALGLMLLVTAGLLLRSFHRLAQVDPGLNPTNVLTFNFELPDAKYKDNKQQFYQDLMPRLQALPGVTAAAGITPLPLSGNNYSISFQIEGRPVPAADEPSAAFRVGTPGYFQAMGIPMLNGRDFTPGDVENSPLVTIINEAFARRYFPNENPIGKRIIPGVRRHGENVPREIVGIVGNVRHEALSGDVTPEYYLPHAQQPFASLTICLKTTGDPHSLTSAARNAIASIDPDLPVYDVRTMQEYIAQTLATPRFHAMLLEAFAGLALLLTGIGLYGVIAYAVAQRTHEIGVRMTLGASRSEVVRMVLKSGFQLTAIGVAVGVVLSLIVARFATSFSSLLFGTKPTDAGTFATVIGIITIVSLLACYIPAYRASKVDPMIALRYE
jgi:putative ABC transport system permease protein